MILFLWKGCSALILKQKVYSPTLPNLKHLLWLKTQNWKLLEEWCCLVLIWWWRTFTNQQFFVACLICDHSKAISYPVFPSTSSLKYDSLKKYLLDAFIFNYCTLIFFLFIKGNWQLGDGGIGRRIRYSFCSFHPPDLETSIPPCQLHNGRTLRIKLYDLICIVPEQPLTL